jgi:hypothetical protein
MVLTIMSKSNIKTFESLIYIDMVVKIKINKIMKHLKKSLTKV